MATLNYGTRQLDCKIVYYGPALGGKTTNLKRIHQILPAESCGELTNLATKQDRTLYFDLLPVNLGQVSGYYVKVHLFTVPGQVYYNATRRVVLNGVDGVVMVFDSHPDREAANYQSLANLEENLVSQGLSMETIPIVFQYNKRDLPRAMDREFMSQSLNPDRRYEEFEACAIQGDGVQDTLRSISSQVFSRIEAEMPKRSAPKPILKTSPAAAAVPAKDPLLDSGMMTDAPGVEAPDAAPPEAVRIRQLSDLRYTGVRIGHAVVDLSPNAEREGAPDYSATIEFRPSIGNTRLEKQRFWKVPGPDSPGCVAAYESRPVAGEAPSRMWRVSGEGKPAEVYLQWPALLGTYRLTPEGLSNVPGSVD